MKGSNKIIFLDLETKKCAFFTNSSKNWFLKIEFQLYLRQNVFVEPKKKVIFTKKDYFNDIKKNNFFESNNGPIYFTKLIMIKRSIL